jgi:hypothetical protein
MGDGGVDGDDEIERGYDFCRVGEVGESDDGG